MAKFTLQEVLQATQGESFNCSEDLQFTDVLTDTRELKEGTIFVALKGDKFDGHNYIEVAFAHGVKAVIVSSPPENCNQPFILVDNTLKAYQDLAKFHRKRFDIPVVAITGSSGKTTTKELTACALESTFKVLKTEKNFNNEIGLPKTLLQLDRSHEVCVVEMGMRGLGQIAELAEIALPTHGILTNVGVSHIEILGSRENIAKAKGELFERLPAYGYAILNADDDFVEKIKSNTKANVLTYSLQHGASISGFDLRYKSDGIKFTCRIFDQIFDIFLPMIGLHNISDALAAIAISFILGVKPAKMNKALGDFKGIPLRQEIIKFSDFVILNDAYNANTDSMTQAIKALAQLSSKRKIAMLGDMLELGAYAEEEHRKIGRLLSAEDYAAIYLLGEFAEVVGEEYLKLKPSGKIYIGRSHQEIADAFMKDKQTGDCVLLKGSRGLSMEKIVQCIKA